MKKFKIFLNNRLTKGKIENIIKVYFKIILKGLQHLFTVLLCNSLKIIVKKYFLKALKCRKTLTKNAGF